MTSKPTARCRLSTVAILTTGIVSLLEQPSVQAASYTKTSTGADAWATTAVWTGGPSAFPNAAGDIATYANTAVAGGSTTTLDANITIGQLTKSSNRVWTISASGSGFTLDNTTNSATNAFNGTLAAITTNATNNANALTVNPTITIGNSGSIASPGLLIGVLGTGAITTPSPIAVGGAINGTGALYIASGTTGAGVVTSAITLSGLVNNGGLINVGQYESGSAVQNGTSLVTFSGGIGTSVTGFTNVGANSITFTTAGIGALTGDIVFNGTGASTVNSTTNATINNSGNISNIGTTSGTTQISTIIGSNVGTVTQNSANSQLTLNASNTFSNLLVKTGTVSTNSATGFGAGAIAFGDAAGGNSTLLLTAAAAIVGNSINVGTGALGTLTLASSSTSTAPAFTGPIDNNGKTINLDERSTGTLTLSGAITGNGGLTVVSSGVSTTGATLSGTGANTYTGLTSVQSGILTIGKTAGVAAFAGNFTMSGGLVHPTTSNTIPSAATVTVTGGIFNSNSAANANGGTSTDQTFTTLAVSGSGVFNGGASAAPNGMKVTGTASFTGGTGAAFYMNAGGIFQTASLTVNDMTKSTAPFVALTAPTPAEVANSFTIGGNSTMRQGKVIVGTGGLSLGATQAGGNYLLLRTGGTASTGLGSLLALDGDVTTTGTAASNISVDVAGSAGTNALTTTGVQLSSTAVAAVVRNFNVAGGGADLNITAPIFNGTAFANGLNKLGSGTLNLDRATGSSSTASNFTGATTVNGGTLRVSAAGALNATASITVNNTGNFLVGNSLFGGAATTDRVKNSAPVTVNPGGTVGVASGTSSLSETMGVLTLSSGAKLDFSSGDTNTLQFGGLTSVIGLSLSITNWSGSTYALTDTADNSLATTQDRFLFNAAVDPAYTDADLAGILFYDSSQALLGPAHQVLFSPGVYELVPIPEPASALSALLAAGLLGLGRRRLFRKRLAGQ